MFISSDYFLDAAIAISVGSLSPTINWRDLAKLEFELPSLDEQKKLAEVLWAINDTLHAYQNLLVETDELVKSQFIEMFGKLGFDDKGWGLTTLDKCCELNPRRPRDIDDGLDVSFLAMPDVSEDGHVDLSVIRPYKDVKKGFTYFAENDVLFAKINAMHGKRKRSCCYRTFKWYRIWFYRISCVTSDTRDFKSILVVCNNDA